MLRSFSSFRWLHVVVLVVCGAALSASSAGCGDDDNSGAGATAGAGGTAPEGGAGGTAGAAGAGAGGAAEIPSSTRLTITRKGVSFPLDRAQFGLTTSTSQSGATMYVEAHFGGDPACPTASSPSPSRTLIITGFPAGAAPGTVFDYDSGARVNLLDFDKTITAEPILKATAVTITAFADNPCVTCPSTDESADRFAAFTVEATFSDGATLTGTVRAMHCGSLDVAE